MLHTTRVNHNGLLGPFRFQEFCKMPRARSQVQNSAKGSFYVLRRIRARLMAVGASLYQEPLHHAICDLLPHVIHGSAAFSQSSTVSLDPLYIPVEYLKGSEGVGIYRRRRRGDGSQTSDRAKHQCGCVNFLCATTTMDAADSVAIFAEGTFEEQVQYPTDCLLQLLYSQ
jgi:hypothetical protein